MRRLIAPRKWVIFGAGSLMSISLLLSLHSGVASALTTSDLNCNKAAGADGNHCLSNGLNTAENWDADCYDYLNSYKNSSTYNLRDIINGIPGGGSSSYRDSTWLSQRNYSRTSSPVQITYGATNVPLQINAVTFICGPLVSPDNNYSTTTNLPASPYASNVLGQTGRWVNIAGNADDKAPNAPGSTNLYPARTGDRAKITGARICRVGSPCEDGSVSSGVANLSIGGSPANDYLTVSRSNGSRYWFAPPATDISVVSSDPGGITKDVDLYISLSFRYIAAYAGGVYRCDGGNGFITVGGWSDADFSRCEVQHKSLHLYLNVPPAPDNPPGGSITVSCSADKTTASATAAFNDADGSSTYPLKGTLSSSIFTKSATVNAKNGSVTLSGVPVPAATHTVTFNLTVPDVGPNPKLPDFKTSKTVNCTQPPGNGCPSLADSHVSVNLPDQAPSSPAPSGTTSSPGTYEQDTPQNKTKVTSIDDISSGGSRDPPPKVSESYQNVVLDYSPYMNDYSYDYNQPSVTYDSYYNRTMWSTAGPFYSCPAGWSPPSGSTTCTQTTTTTYNPGQHCVLSGFTCTWVNNPCNPGDSGAYPTCTHTSTSTQAATVYYTWVKGATTNDLTKSNTVNGTLMSPCYQRQFTVDSVTNDQTNLDDQENPSTVTGGGGTIHVTFSYDGVNTPAKGLRLPMQVKLDWDANYTINNGGPPLCSRQTGPKVTVFGTTGPGPATASVPNSSCSATVPPLQAGDRICGLYEISPTGDSMLVDGTVNPPGGNGDTATDGPVCSAPVVNEPYARFYGSDVTAGGAFATGSNKCAGTPMNLGTIRAYERGTGPQSTGAGSQLAALSLGQISGFASAFLRSLAPTSPTGLSFANTTPGFGGNLGSTYQHCVPDYYGGLPAANAPWAGDFSTGGAYTYTGDLVLPPGLLSNGTNISIYVRGNVYVSGDLNYQTNGWKVTGNTSNIPSLYIIATGSINIAPNVDTIDGVFVAQNNTIHTCAPGAGSSNLYDATELYDKCHTTLRVNGSLVARDIILDRTYSSLRHSQSGENPYSFGLHSCDVGGGAFIDPKIDCSAEIFSLGLDTYLSSPSITPRGGPKTGKFDAITSLSPIL